MCLKLRLCGSHAIIYLPKVWQKYTSSLCKELHHATLAKVRASFACVYTPNNWTGLLRWHGVILFWVDIQTTNYAAVRLLRPRSYTFFWQSELFVPLIVWRSVSNRHWQALHALEHAWERKHAVYSAYMSIYLLEPSCSQPNRHTWCRLNRNHTSNATTEAQHAPTKTQTRLCGSVWFSKWFWPRNLRRALRSACTLTAFTQSCQVSCQHLVPSHGI